MSLSIIFAFVLLIELLHVVKAIINLLELPHALKLYTPSKAADIFLKQEKKE